MWNDDIFLTNLFIRLGWARLIRYSGRSACAIGIMALCLLAASDSRAQVASTDWPGFLGESANGKSPQSKITTDWASGKLKKLWSQRLGEGYGIGSLAKGRFYQFDRIKNNSRLLSLDAKTGEVVWKFQYETNYEDMYGFDGGPRSSPLITRNRVYIFGVEGWLHCLDSETGRVVWKIDTAEKFGVIQNFFGVGSSPIVFQDQLIVMIGGSPAESQSVQKGALNRVSPNRSAIVAFDLETGEVLYQTGNDLASYSTPIVCEFDGKPRCLAFCRERLLMFDPRDGRILDEFAWRAKKLESVNASTPVVFGNNVFITEGYGPGAAMLKVKNDQFETAWKDEGREKSINSHWATPIVVDGFIYGCHGESRADAELRCIDSSTGQIRWSQLGLDRTTLTKVGKHFVCLSESGKIKLLEIDPEEFRVKSEYEPGSEGGVRLLAPCWSAPVVADGKMFVRSKDKLVCFDVAVDQ